MVKYKCWRTDVGSRTTIRAPQTAFADWTDRNGCELLFLLLEKLCPVGQKQQQQQQQQHQHQQQQQWAMAIVAEEAEPRLKIKKKEAIDENDATA